MIGVEVSRDDVELALGALTTATSATLLVISEAGIRRRLRRRLELLAALPSDDERFSSARKRLEDESSALAEKIGNSARRNTRRWLAVATLAAAALAIGLPIAFDLLGFGDASNLLGFLAGVTIIVFGGLLTARLERFRRTRRMTTEDTSPETVDV